METGKVKYFFVGSPKCGTSTLSTFLSQFQDVSVGIDKEVHFFSQREVLSESYYKVPVINNLEEYHKNYNLNKGIVCDFSPSYFNKFASHDKIKTYNTDARIIVITRDPVERFISHFLMDQSLGYNSFSLNNYLENPDKFSSEYRKEYFENSMYIKYIQNLTKTFGVENVHVEKFENLFPLTSDSVCNLLNFLGLDYDSNNTNYEIRENSYQVYSFPIHKYLRSSNVMKYVKNRLPLAMINLMKRFFKTSKSSKPKFVEERAKLQRIFSETDGRTNG